VEHILGSNSYFSCLTNSPAWPKCTFRAPIMIRRAQSVARFDCQSQRNLCSIQLSGFHVEAPLSYVQQPIERLILRVLCNAEMNKNAIIGILLYRRSHCIASCLRFIWSAHSEYQNVFASKASKISFLIKKKFAEKHKKYFLRFHSFFFIIA
jgi:hypothetical protein